MHSKSAHAQYGGREARRRDEMSGYETMEKGGEILCLKGSVDN